MTGSDEVLLVAGLSTSFSAGTIYCSKVTANLLVKDMRINPSCIQPLPLDTPLLVDGVHVTLIDANHCPGAVLFLFKTPAPPGSEFPEQVQFLGTRGSCLPLGIQKAGALTSSAPLQTRRSDLKYTVRSQGCR